MPQPALLELFDLTRRFPGVLALDGVSLTLRAREVHAIVGENGAGKSTLINIICGLLQSDSGHMRLNGRPVAWTNPVDARRSGIVTVHQEAELFPTLSVAENMALERGMAVGRGGWVRWRSIYRTAREVVDLLGEPIDVGQDATRLSVAQRHMTQIAAAVFEQAVVLVLDEPSSALTGGETEWLFGQIAALKAKGVGIIYISHRQEEIFRLADRITVLRDGRRVWSGPRDAIDRGSLIRHMVGRDRAGPAPRRKASSPEPARPLRLQVEHLSSADGRVVNVSLTAHAGEVLGLYGLVGSGRSEFARVLFGLDKRDGGKISIDGRPVEIASPARAVAAGLAYMPEDRLRQGVFRGLSVRANVVISILQELARGPLSSVRLEQAAARGQIDSLNIRCRNAEQPIGQLSGGNQQKVVLGRWLLTRPAILVLDEPTRGIDVGAKAEIHRLLRRVADGGTAIVLISSDLPEVIDQSDRVLVFREGQIVAQFDSDRIAPEAIAAATLGQNATPKPSGATRPHSAPTKRRMPAEAALAVAIAILFVALTATTDAFFTLANLEGLASNCVVWIILSLAAAVVILAGGIDISLGSLLGLSAAAAGLTLKLPYSPALTVPAGIVVGLAVGAAGGLANASLALVGRVHPIVVTLGTMIIFRGLLIALTGGDTITDLPSAFVGYSTERLLGVNGAVAMGAVAALAVYVWLAHLRGGRHLVALGSSATAARLVGISPARVWLAAFGAGGLLAGLAGLVELSQTGAMQSGMGTGYELRAVAAAVIGGVSISGGRGSVLGACLGALLLSTIYNAVVLWQISPYHNMLLTGALLLAAVLVDLVWRRLAR